MLRLDEERFDGPHEEEDDQPEPDEREEDERLLDDERDDEERKLDDRELDDRELDERELEDREDGGIQSPFHKKKVGTCLPLRGRRMGCFVTEINLL